MRAEVGDLESFGELIERRQAHFSAKSKRIFSAVLCLADPAPYRNSSFRSFLDAPASADSSVNEFEPARVITPTLIRMENLIGALKVQP
jgi:hypothetical protein